MKVNQGECVKIKKTRIEKIKEDTGLDFRHVNSSQRCGTLRNLQDWNVTWVWRPRKLVLTRKLQISVTFRVEFNLPECKISKHLHMDGFPFLPTDSNKHFYNIIHLTLKKVNNWGSLKRRQRNSESEMTAKYLYGMSRHRLKILKVNISARNTSQCKQNRGTS